MYINVKKRPNKHADMVFYLYLCESKRVEGKVVNKQKYLASVKYNEVENSSYEQKFSNFDEATKVLVYEKLQSLL